MAAKLVDVIARLPDSDGQAADAISAFTQVKMEDAPRLLRTPKSECPDNVLHDSNGQNHGLTLKIQRYLTGASVGKTVRGSSAGAWMGKSTRLGMSFCFSKTRIIFIGVRG